jgi:hexosaminidase
MKSFPKFLLLVILFFSGVMLSQGYKNLLPVPKKLILHEGSFRLEKSFSLTVTGNPDERIYSAATRFLRRLSGRTGLFFPQDFITQTKVDELASFVISVKRKGKVILAEDESYQLKVSSNKIELISENDIGALRGLETLLQLLSADENGYYFPTVQIEDEPRFVWRGLLIDVSRHFMPIDVIKRNLDGMAAVKMNVFHWHLSDDQGFRVESKVFPKLHQLGSDGFFYSQEQIKDIIAYADARGIRVIPEFDIPGHSTSWFVAFPNLASATGPYKIERNWGVFDPTFNPTIEETYKFFDKFFEEMAKLFPDDYIHIGGDENNGKQWNANQSIQTFMKKNKIPDNHSLQTYFNKRILQILTKHRKKMMGWDEILQPDLPNNIVIQSWRGIKSLFESAQKGYMGILSNGYYIDLIQPASYHYLNDPIPDTVKLTDEEAKFILGGEATSWGELVTYETVDSRIWPRTAAIAERLWSPQNIKDVDDMYRRLDVISFHLEELGLLHIKNQEMMLRRLTNNQPYFALKTLVDVIEPVKIYKRHSQGVKYTSYSPYTRIVDAAQPESREARNFSKMVEQYLLTNDKKVEGQITIRLSLWEANSVYIKRLYEQSPVLREMDSLSINLSKISLAALDAIKIFQKKKVFSKEWFEESLKLIVDAQKPYGQCELMVVNAIEQLIQAAAKNSYNK